VQVFASVVGTRTLLLRQALVGMALAVHLLWFRDWGARAMRGFKSKGDGDVPGKKAGASPTGAGDPAPVPASPVAIPGVELPLKQE
jgi:hypothetical protein